MIHDSPPRPIPAVSGVLFRGNEVLLVRRKAAPYVGRWSLPGGSVEVGETLRDAVVREVLEETGLEVRPMELVGAYDSIVEEGGGIRFHFVLLAFLCQIVGGRLRPGSDASATEWVPLADLEEVDLTPLARTAILEAVRLRDRPDQE